MRVVSYNILDGGEGRADPLAEVIEAQRADVVALVEAENLDVLDRIARRLKMDYVPAAGNSHASALLSRWTIRDSVNHAPLQAGLSKSLLEATVIDPTGEQWSIGVLHLRAHALESDEQKRLAELEIVLGVFAEHRRLARPHIICGDFNSNAPSQKIDPERCKPRTREEWQKNGGKLPREVVQRMLAEGYFDSFHALNASDAETMGTFSTQFPGQRVDYVFTSGVDRTRLKRAWIEQDRLAKYASDHFPIGLEIE
jgi:endonuclease/exonuclease/phosphatase family metal-dependent hydrolase